MASAQPVQQAKQPSMTGVHPDGRDGHPIVAGRPVIVITHPPLVAGRYRNGSSEGRRPLVGCSQRMYCSASQAFSRSRSSARA